MEEALQQIESDHNKRQARELSSPAGSANTSYTSVVSPAAASQKQAMPPPPPPGMINLNDPNISYQDRVEGLTITNLKLSQSVNRLESENKALEARLDKETATLENRLKRRNKEVDHLEKELGDTKGELTSLQSALKQSSQSHPPDYDKLRDDLSAAKQRVTTLNDTILKVTEANKLLKAQIESSPPTTTKPGSSLGQHLCSHDGRVYEAIAFDGELNLAKQLIDYLTHKVPDLAAHPETWAAFRKIIDMAADACAAIDSIWCKKIPSIRLPEKTWSGIRGR